MHSLMRKSKSEQRLRASAGIRPQSVKLFLVGQKPLQGFPPLCRASPRSCVPRHHSLEIAAVHCVSTFKEAL